MPWEIDTGLQILTISRMDTTSPISGGLRLKGLLIPREAVLMLLNRILRVAIALLLLLAIGHCTAPAPGQSQGQLGPQLLLWPGLSVGWIALLASSG